MLPLYAARIEDLGAGDFVKVDCAACHHVALLTPEALLRAGLSTGAKILDLKGRLRCRGAGGKGGRSSRLGGEGRASEHIILSVDHNVISSLFWAPRYRWNTYSRPTAHPRMPAT
jgi:hypothetical protein